MIERPPRFIPRPDREPDHKPLSILDALDDKALFRPFFKNPRTWATWRTILAAIFALPMTEQQLSIYRQVTGRTEPPTEVAKEVDLIIGRRGGKSRIISLVAVWLAAFFDYRPFLSPGEKGVVQIIAADRKQARTCVRYCKSFLKQTPMLAGMIESETKESIDLDNDIILEVATASFRSVRGFTVVAVLLDEIAFFRTDESSANPDSEIVAAIRPAMATIPNSMLLAASSPYAKRGVLYEAHKKHFGKDNDPILVVQADTATTNPAVDPKVISDAYEADPISASAEYGAQFRSDIETFVSREIVEACVSRNVFERARQPGLKYFGFVDPSGGSSDSFSLAIAHKDGDSLILDCIREVIPPFSPETVCGEFAEVLKSYGLRHVTGDHYAKNWPVEQFAKVGVIFAQCASPKSDLYLHLLPLLNSRRVQLLDNKRLIAQLSNLTARSGRDSVTHPPGLHDDVANAVAGAVTAIAVRKPGIVISTLAPPYVRVGWKPPPPPRPQNILSGHNGNNDCIPGRSIAPNGLYEAAALQFNAQRNLRRPR